ncbi:MAG TPA: thiamine pyrophosphate-binding protein [Actinomycetes bacterium]|nr:thiamine pyrophosphate-binding protein [Actinomycetes bacterium]
MQVAQAVAGTLADLGADRVFGVIGSGNYVATTALDARGARFVAARHESAAVCMADGYARATGRVGVASVHQGPGLTNARTGLAEAAKSRTPLLLLAADTPAAAVHSNFRVDQAAACAAVGAAVERVNTPQSALQDVERAWRRARHHRRAVVLLLPLDVQAAELPPAPPPATPPAPRPPSPAAGAVAEAADLVERSRRPVVLAGRGAVPGDARERLVELADGVGALLATSAVANGLFAGHPFDLGISGSFSSPATAELLAGADLVLGFGASLNNWTTKHGALIAPGARVVQVDLDEEAIGSRRAVDVGVVADAAAAAAGLAEELRRRGFRGQGARSPELAARIAAGRWRDQPYQDGSTDTTIDPRTLTIALDDLLPADRALAVDSGHFMGWPVMYLPVADARSFVFNQAYQSIGLGLGAAIGAAVADLGRVTVAALGDGGTFMSLGELETAARLRLPLLVVVYNDDAYGAEVHHFADRAEGLDLVRFPETDLAAVGRALGTDGVTVRGLKDLEAVASWLGHRDRPLVVDAKVTPTVVGEWLEEAFRGG